MAVHITVKVERIQIRSIRLAVVGLALSFIFSGLVLTIPSNVSAAPDEHVWDGGGANVYAGTHLNWVSDIAPTVGDSIVFNSGALPCTWNLTFACENFSMLTGYTGVLTIGASFEVSSFYMQAGTLTGSTSFVLTDSGSFTRSGGTVTNNVLRLTMTGDDTSIACSGTLYDLTVSANITISTNALGIRHSLTINAGKTLTVPAGTGLNWQTIGAGTFTNNGVIAGASTFYIYTYNVGATVSFGSISISTVYLWLQSGGTSNTITLGSVATLDVCHLKIYSAQAGQSLTLNTANYALSILRLTIELRGILTAGSSEITIVNHNWDSSAGTFNAGTSTVIMDGDSKTVATAPTQSFYNFRSRANPCITASNISVSHDLIVDAANVLTIGSGYFLNYNCSGGGTYSNLGMITSPGTMVYTFDTASTSLTVGTLNANVWIKGSSTASGDRTLDLVSSTTFGRALYLFSESSHLMILDARGVSVLVTMGFVNGTNGMLYYTDWNDATPYTYNIYCNTTHYYARNMETGAIENSSLLAEYADQVVQYAVNETRIGGAVHFTAGEYVFETPNDFYVGGWNYSVGVAYAYQLTISGDGSTLRFRDNLQVAVGKGVAVFLVYGTSENVTFEGLDFEWSPGLTADYSSGMFFSNAIIGMTVQDCTFTGLNWSIWQDGTEFGLANDAGNYYLGNTFNGGWRGMALHNIQSTTVISGNTWVNIGSALMIDSVEDVLIQDNTFSYSGEEYCIDVWDKCDNITITQNYFEGYGTTTYGVTIDQVDGKYDVSNVTVHDNAFINFTSAAILVEASNYTSVTSNSFLNINVPIVEGGTHLIVNGNVNYTINSTAMGGFDYSHEGFIFPSGYMVDVLSTLDDTKDVFIESVAGIVTEFAVLVEADEDSDISFALGGYAVIFTITSDMWVNMSVDWSPNGGVAFTTNQGMTCLISDLDADMSYKVYQDGDVIETGTGPTFSFTATGGGEYEIVVWYPKTVSSMVILAVNMVGLGILVSVIAGWVIPFSRAIKAGTYRRTDLMMKELMRGFIFIVVALIMWVMLQKIAIG